MLLLNYRKLEINVFKLFSFNKMAECHLWVYMLYIVIMTLVFTLDQDVSITYMHVKVFTNIEKQ